MKRTGHETWVGTTERARDTMSLGSLPALVGRLCWWGIQNQGSMTTTTTSTHTFLNRLNCCSIAMFCSHRDTHRPVRNGRSLEMKCKGSLVSQQKVFQSPHNYFKGLDLHLILDFFFPVMRRSTFYLSFFCSPSLLEKLLLTILKTTFVHVRGDATSWHFYKTGHVTFTLHDLTFISGGGRAGGAVKGGEAA